MTSRPTPGWEYLYTFPDGSSVACIDWGNGQAACAPLGLGPMPQAELHEALDLHVQCLGALPEGATSHEPGGWTLTRTGPSAWRVEYRGGSVLVVTAPNVADALAACRNARLRARRARLDDGYPVGWDVAKDVLACGTWFIVTLVALPWALWS